MPILTLPLDTGPVGAGVTIDGLHQSCASPPVEASPIEASPPSPVVAPDVGKRHSARVRKIPSWMKDYVMG